ncbi:unnamed protein product [Miscanthus lutarioriparius]|uniref:Uncharacterized protein n=1 Tax=Miscanthus lutarioriparius TaxID=422564 RepID=A0A811RIT8_9POAL|nr:unnamed protein product [Miscanthus lutarioriparius]
MAGTYLPLAALLLATAVAILAATSAVPVVAAAAADKYSGRMVIIHAPGSSRVVSAGGALNKWQQQRRLVEDEVAPEFGSLLGAGNGGGHVSTDALNPNRPLCLPHAQCAAHGPGGSNTRPCTYIEHCAHTPTVAGHARAVHG